MDTDAAEHLVPYPIKQKRQDFESCLEIRGKTFLLFQFAAQTFDTHEGKAEQGEGYATVRNGRTQDDSISGGAVNDTGNLSPECRR